MDVSEGRSTSVIEDRIFELLGEGKITEEIAEELALPYGEAVGLIRKVVEERGTPQGVRVRQALDRLDKIRF